MNQSLPTSRKSTSNIKSSLRFKVHPNHPSSKVLGSQIESRKFQNDALLLILAALIVTVTLQLIAIDYFFLGKNGSIENEERSWSEIQGIRGDSSRSLVDNVITNMTKETKDTNNINLETKEGLLNDNHDTSKKDADILRKDGVRPLDVILRKAGVDLSDGLINSLPPPGEVESMYGNKPIILGLDRCAAFRKAIPAEDAFIAPAGMFNSGTNLLQELLHKNCAIKEKLAKCSYCPGIREQVPWGKHSPASWRLNHLAIQASDIPQENMLPIVVVKDPYTWMASMCRHHYAANWFYEDKHCPNLVPVTDLEKSKFDDKAIPVRVKYNSSYVSHHESLVGLWNDWYREYSEATFPRLIIRFEDMMFWTETVVKQVCECAGGTLLHDEVTYIVDSAKADKAKVHQGSSGLVTAMTKYANSTQRKEQFTQDDLDYAKTSLNEELLELFNYKKIT